MAKVDCSACDELRQLDADFVINGFSDENCEHLSDNAGLVTGDDNNSCDDLHLMNDCLVGMMEKEVKAYETCDWKKFMVKLIPNLWTTLKGIICTLCGVNCRTNVLMNGINLKISEDDSGESYIVAGKGISFFGTGSASRESQVTFHYLGGALVQVTGSLLFNKDDFTDTQECYNFDDGDEMHKRSARKGNSVWQNTSGTVQPMASGGELLYEIRISKKQYPEIRKIYGGNAAPSGGGAYQVNLTVFEDKDSDGNPIYAYGQHGNCDTKTGEPESGSGHSKGHKVKEDYIYVQARMVNISYLNATGNRYSPKGFMGIKLNKNQIEC